LAFAKLNMLILILFVVFLLWINRLSIIIEDQFICEGKHVRPTIQTPVLLAV
jgi:hypothetical protein